MIVGGTVAFAFAAAYYAYAVRPRFAIVAFERHLSIPDHVINAPVLKGLRARPHLTNTTSVLSTKMRLNVNVNAKR